MTATRTPYGTHGHSVRQAGKPAKLTMKRALQAHSGRKKSAVKETREAQEKLERIMRRQQEAPASGPAIGAVFKDLTHQALGVAPAVEQQAVPPRVSPPRHRHRFEPYEGEPVPGWTVARAWGLLEQGYTVMHAMHRSGCGWMHFEHLRIGEDGRLLPE